MTTVTSPPLAPQAQPPSSSPKFVSIHQLPDGSWAWRKVNSVHPGSVRLSSERFLSRYDCESAAATVALADRLDLRLPGDADGRWADLALRQVASS